MLNNRVDVPNLVTYRNQPLIFEWYVVLLLPRSDTIRTREEIKESAQNTIITIVSIINIVGGDLHDHLMSTRISTLIMNKNFIWTPTLI